MPVTERSIESVERGLAEFHEGYRDGINRMPNRNRSGSAAYDLGFRLAEPFNPDEPNTQYKPKRR